MQDREQYKDNSLGHEAHLHLLIWIYTNDDDEWDRMMMIEKWYGRQGRVRDDNERAEGEG